MNVEARLRAQSAIPTPTYNNAARQPLAFESRTIQMVHATAAAMPAHPPSRTALRASSLEKTATQTGGTESAAAYKKNFGQNLRIIDEIMRSNRLHFQHCILREKTEMA